MILRTEPMTNRLIVTHKSTIKIRKCLITFTFSTPPDSFLRTFSPHLHHCAASQFKGISAARPSVISVDASSLTAVVTIATDSHSCTRFCCHICLVFFLFFTASSCCCSRYYCFAASVLQCEHIRYSVFYGFPF